MNSTTVKPISVFVGVLSLLVFFALIGAIMHIDSPAESRMKKHDDLKVSTLQNLSSAIDDYYDFHDELPQSLSEVEDTYSSWRYNEENPFNNSNYGYEVVDAIAGKYKLCATFETQSDQDDDYRPYFYDRKWDHDAGWQCFELTVPALLTK
jgi:hypothetical protein